MIERVSQFLLRFRLAVWGVVLALTLALGWFVPAIQFDQSVESFFPDDHPALVAYERSKTSFGGDHLIFVVYDDPQLWTAAGMERVRELADALAAIDGVEKVDAMDQMPVPWKVDDAVAAMTSKSKSLFKLMTMLGGRITVKMLVKSSAHSPERQAETRQQICAHPLFNGLLVDAEGKSTAVVVRLGDPERHHSAVTSIREAADKFGATHKVGRVAVAGPPVLIVDGFESIEHDNRTLGIVAMLLMSLTMFVAVRNPGWALLPLMAGWATWEITKAFLVGFDLRLSLSSGPIIAQTIVLCMPAASHLAVRYGELLRQGLSKDAAIAQSHRAVFLPVAWCAMTAASGYLAMWAATSVAPVAQFGLTMFVCNLIAGAFTWSLGPGSMVFAVPWIGRQSGAETGAVVSQGVGSMTDWVIRHPGRTLGLFIAPVLLAAVGMSQLAFESNYINVFRPTARVARDYTFIEERMGGIGLVELVFPAPKQVTREWLSRLAETSSELDKVDPDLVSSVISLADILTFPRDLGDADPQDFLNQKIELLSTESYSHFLTNFWDREHHVMRILVRIRESAQADRKEQCFVGMQQKVRVGLSKDVFVTGLSHLMTQITHAMVVTSFASGAWSAGISLLMLWVALRSFRMALLALLPTLLAVGLVLGVMGWIGLKIDMSTVFVASVAIGLSVDDAFHCLLRWKENLHAGQTPLEGLHEAYTGSGAGVVLSSAGVSLGFLAMLFSDFLPMFHYGWLISVATLGGSLGNLVVIPAVLAYSVKRPDPSAPSR